jgi:UDP-glucose 4-epimerase
VVLRPPLVYGPGVKGNFLRLMQWVARGWPLPLGSVENRRSLIYVGNLLRLAAALAGQGTGYSSLTGSLQVDSSRIRRELGWEPRYTLAQGLEETARWYHSHSA